MLPGIDMLRLFFQRIINKKIHLKAGTYSSLLDNYNYKIAISLSLILMLTNSFNIWFK